MSSATKERLRPGGRSARVQESVHAAVRALMAEHGRAALTVPLIATHAGVTPSTIYRRWGDLPELLADVAVERLRPESAPISTGDLRTDLQLWIDQFVDEMSSGPGRTMVRDVLAGGGDGPNTCCSYTQDQLEIILEHAARRGDVHPAIDAVMDEIISPIMYRIVFRGETLRAAYVHGLIAACLARVAP
ncbi:TetR family transcriptional regulator [Pigmentiphaga litoralis]|uniref:TetR/AcrR family transcriptional regulator n=1 Tax=Pigmentiphaga litoralis TaxID=516702 RepID=UPI0016743942|nr:TetR/AcrR family transcriptional regulator [Pigmentiphaga litoralis]GGX14344.1 TetR family transcriptional regulator [Pigmentiphaga litoralis]